MNAPWIAGPIHITRDVLEAMRVHAREAYPSECCGFASGPVSEPLVVDASVREVNEADKYHRLDPESFPRTSREYFKINELLAAKAFQRAVSEERPIKIIYHSHCDAGDHFSAEDAETFAHDGALMWPCAFIVVSVMDGEPVSQRCWVHVPGTNSFAETPLLCVG
jgi:proteasome lid subunit RPN8/RPN11